MICTYICTYKLGNMYYLIVNNVGGDGEKEWTLFFVVVVMQLRNVEKQTDVQYMYSVQWLKARGTVLK